MPKSENPVHALQLWINLPKQRKMMEPRYQDIPRETDPHAFNDDKSIEAVVLAGEVFGKRGPIETEAAVTYVHFMLSAGAKLEYPIPSSHNAFVYAVSGTGKCVGHPLQPHEAIVLEKEGDCVLLTAANDDKLEVVVMTGEPLNEPVVQYGPFVMNSEEIRQAFEDFKHAKNGFENARTWATFDHQTSAGVWFVKFYAPWCGHCKKLAPTIDEMSEADGLAEQDVHVAKVDCTTERSICERFSVGSYPTLKVVTGGKSYDYNGRRDVPAMVAFATKGYKKDFGERVLSGYKKAEAIGPIPEEGFFSKIVDITIEWATEHTVLAVLAGILVIAIVVAILVALLDYWLGADDVAQYKKALDEKEAAKKEAEKEGEEEELPPRVPSAAEAKKSGQKPKDE
ncbi:unnamed protein product [Phytophthora lilii]|uniref:Unnamed protein product n=1 Tax=Phytophthora lilii TaxID=2077276 RepID=A0A9W6X2D9_9STRA|nr:unnamed protein product [Phytophthora lilii]